MNKKLIFSVLTALLIGAAGFLFFYKIDKKPNIIVILVDTLRADHLGVYGYERNTSPNVDALAKESLVYNLALGVSSWTVPGVASILSGLYPTAHGMTPIRDRPKAATMGTKLSQKIESLPEVLKTAGYQTAAVSTNPWISRQFSFDQGFDNFYYFDRAPAEKVVKSAVKNIDKFISNPEQPFFLYLHFLDPHSPYTPPEPYKKLFSGPLKRFNYDQKALDKIGLYDGEVKYFDDQIGVFLDYLKSKGLYEDSVIVFVSDHGEAFHEHGHGGHGYHLYIEEVRIPLFIKAANRIGRVSSAVSQIDIFPTLTELAGANTNPNLLGINLLNTEKLKKRSGVLSEVYRVFKERSFSTENGERLIVENAKDSADNTEFAPKGLFDLKNDPLEQKPISDKQLESELNSRLNSLHSALSQVAETEDLELDQDSVSVLQTLGYLND